MARKERPCADGVSFALHYRLCGAAVKLEEVSGRLVRRRECADCRISSFSSVYYDIDKTDERIIQRLPPPELGGPRQEGVLLQSTQQHIQTILLTNPRTFVTARNYLEKLKSFLKTQAFDEIIILENNDATPANIDYFIGR